ncbi:hypothetical protein DEU56DRAFT_800340 [Suillus clintonianus]|uniref:uncharacterized protein n=1 Tax=Suillus clintonianus TaxID=1904413 RepID=UPI001B86F1BB|nr:uncharacterized protein DEU56DRAFT_800340 [Suillus clintonianus]KAG2139239.1 hypothetical protein DEU56DRAFT_800340 [Suillus clintonianus]
MFSVVEAHSIHATLLISIIPALSSREVTIAPRLHTSKSTNRIECIIDFSSGVGEADRRHEKDIFYHSARPD